MRKIWLASMAGMGLSCLAAAQGVGYQPPQGARQVPPVMIPAPPSAAEIEAAAAGGVPTGTASAQPVALGLADAIDRGLSNNLAGLLSASQSDQARAQHFATMSALLPRVDAGAGEIRQKINLAAFGLNLPGIPAIVGPFDVFNANISASSSLFNLSARRSEQAAASLVGAARDALQAARDMIVLAVANQYLLTVADASRVQAAQAELTTAEQQYTLAQDMKTAGTADALVVVRAGVQREAQRQKLIAEQNELAKQRLQLARAIGLPLGQTFTLTDAASPKTLPAPDPAAAVAQALATRPDYRAAEAAVAAAKWQVAAAHDQRLPTLAVDGQYGPVGREITSSQPVYSAAATVTVPLLEGGLFKADTLSAQAQLRDTENRAADLRAAIDGQVRSALFDLQSSASQAEVAQSAQSLARQELTLSSDRFHAGVADNLEVVEAQQAVAEADDNVIGSLYALNVAKARLAQALGVAQASWRQYLQ